METALALSGSAAPSKIQTNPGDCDYFERINLHAPSREAACQMLSGLMREKALATERGETHRLIEVKFGSSPRDMLHAGKPLGLVAVPTISAYIGRLQAEFGEDAAAAR